MLPRHDGLKAREVVDSGTATEAGGPLQKEVIHWSISVVATEVVPSDASRRAVRRTATPSCGSPLIRMRDTRPGRRQGDRALAFARPLVCPACSRQECASLRPRHSGVAGSTQARRKSIRSRAVGRFFNIAEKSFLASTARLTAAVSFVSPRRTAPIR